MPILKMYWYSVPGHGDDRYRMRRAQRSWRDVAMDAAEDYHGHHDGWESVVWPLEFIIYEEEDGPAVARFNIEREFVPEFFAWEMELPQSVAAKKENEDLLSRVDGERRAAGPTGSTAAGNEVVPADDGECPACGGGLRGSFPLCIDCQIVDAMKRGE